MNTHRVKGEEANIRGCKPKEMAAIDAFMSNGFVKKKALIAAGYKGHGTYLFEKENVRTEIQRRMLKTELDRQKAYSKAKIKNNVTKERLINEYAKIAFAPLKNGSRKIATCIEDGEVITKEVFDLTQEQIDIGADIPVDPKDKKTALDSLAKLEGLFVDHLKISDEREVVANLLAGRKRAAAQKQLSEDTGGDYEEAEVVE